MIAPTSTLTDVAFAVCTALDDAGVTAVLTGGSAATFYAPEAYQSVDLDFVITMNASRQGHDVLTALGFVEAGGVHRHPKTRFTLDFPRGPLAVGDDTISAWNTVHRDGELLHVLSPTDSCRDRLASFLFWNDFSGLEQALAVARAQAVDLPLIKSWCRRERQPQKLDVFETRLTER